MRPWVSSGSLATSGGGGGGGLLRKRNATKPPASRPSIIRKISREAAGSMAEIGESAAFGSSEDKGPALEGQVRISSSDRSPYNEVTTIGPSGSISSVGVTTTEGRSLGLTSLGSGISETITIWP